MAGSNATVWNPNTETIPAVNSENTVLTQKFTATSGQTLFTLTDFAYTPGTNSLLILIDGELKISGADYEETSTSSFTLLSGATSGDKVAAIGFVAITGTVDTPSDGSVTPEKLSSGFILPVDKAPSLEDLGAMPVAGGVFTGPVTLDADAADDLEPVTLQQLTAAIDDAITPPGFGVGQSWSNQFGTKADNTVYRNTSSPAKPWMIKAEGAAAGHIQISVSIDNITYTVIANGDSGAVANLPTACDVVIPPGHYYKVHALVGALTAWKELS